MTKWDRHIPIRKQDGEKPYRDDWRQDKKGDMLRDGYRCTGKQGDTEGHWNWIPADTKFYALLTLIDYGKGRSAVWFELEDHDGILYYMNLSHIVELFARTKGNKKGLATGWWTYEKVGSAYGIKPIDEPLVVRKTT